MYWRVVYLCTFFRRHATFYQNVPLRDQSATKKNAFYTDTIGETVALRINYFFLQSLINKRSCIIKFYLECYYY